MAWTDIPDLSLDVGKPARSVDVKALRDNVLAQAQGAAGAPRTQGVAIADSAITVSKLATNSVPNAKVVTNAIDNRTLTSPFSSTAQLICSVQEGVNSVISEGAYPEWSKTNQNGSIGFNCLVAGSIVAYMKFTSNVSSNEIRILKNGAVVAAWPLSVSSSVVKSANISVSVGDEITFQAYRGFAGLAYWHSLRVYSATKNFAVA